MIEWYWAIISLFIGAVLGVSIVGLVSANGRDDLKKWWEE